MRRRVIRLGGRDFVSVTESTTAQHDDHFKRERRRSGLAEIAQQPGEDLEAFGRRIIADIELAGRQSILMSYVIVPRGKRWSPEVARQTARHLDRLRSPQDKATRTHLLAELLIDFFVRGLSSLTTSVTALSDAATAPNESGPGTNGTANGPTSSSPSPRQAMPDEPTGDGRSSSC